MYISSVLTLDNLAWRSSNVHGMICRKGEISRFPLTHKFGLLTLFTHWTTPPWQHLNMTMLCRFKTLTCLSLCLISVCMAECVCPMVYLWYLSCYVSCTCVCVHVCICVHTCLCLLPMAPFSDPAIRTVTPFICPWSASLLSDGSLTGLPPFRPSRLTWRTAASLSNSSRYITLLIYF